MGGSEANGLRDEGCEHEFGLPWILTLASWAEMSLLGGKGSCRSYAKLGRSLALAFCVFSL